MKRKVVLICLLLCISLSAFILPACEASADGSVKEITKPYIAQYECVEARLGDSDFLDQYDYIKIILVNSEKMQLVFKQKGSDKCIVDGDYKLDFKTRELEGEIGFLGYKFREKVTVNKGEFVISRPILTKQLYMKFKNI